LNLKKRNNWKNGIIRTLYIIPIYIMTVNLRQQITIVTFVVTTIALAPSLTSLISSHAQTTTTSKIVRCEEEKGQTHTWISGCKDGWYNWDVCGLGPDRNPKPGSYDAGYTAGWKKGQQHNPGRVGCSNK
jgi:hypothetical protein